MTKFITEFKNRAHKKELTSGDMLALCVYKTIKSKGEDKKAIFTHLIKKSFRPSKRNTWYGLYNARNILRWRTLPKLYRDEGGVLTKTRTILTLDLFDVFTIEEVELFDSLVDSVTNFDGEIE